MAEMSIVDASEPPTVNDSPNWTILHPCLLAEGIETLGSDCSSIMLSTTSRERSNKIPFLGCVHALYEA